MNKTIKEKLKDLSANEIEEIISHAEDLLEEKSQLGEKNLGSFISSINGKKILKQIKNLNKRIITKEKFNVNLTLELTEQAGWLEEDFDLDTYDIKIVNFKGISKHVKDHLEQALEDLFYDDLRTTKLTPEIKERNSQIEKLRLDVNKIEEQMSIDKDQLWYELIDEVLG